MCQHCKQYGFECTFFLPITETRFKKKRLEEEAQAAAVHTAHRQTSTQAEKDTKAERSVEPEGSQKSPLPDGTHNVRIDGKHAFNVIDSIRGEGQRREGSREQRAPAPPDRAFSSSLHFNFV